jgi:hypothetical protein
VRAAPRAAWLHPSRTAAAAAATAASRAMCPSMRLRARAASPREFLVSNPKSFPICKNRAVTQKRDITQKRERTTSCAPDFCRLPCLRAFSLLCALHTSPRVQSTLDAHAARVRRRSASPHARATSDACALCLAPRRCLASPRPRHCLAHDLGTASPTRTPRALLASRTRACVAAHACDQRRSCGALLLLFADTRRRTR